jgi:hypothetical protein
MCSLNALGNYLPTGRWNVYHEVFKRGGSLGTLGEFTVGWMTPRDLPPWVRAEDGTALRNVSDRILKDLGQTVDGVHVGAAVRAYRNYEQARQVVYFFFNNLFIDPRFLAITRSTAAEHEKRLSYEGLPGCFLDEVVLVKSSRFK